MKAGVAPLERAFQLARSGSVGNVTELKTALKREGYSSEVIEGRTLTRQLRELIQIAREGAEASRGQADDSGCATGTV